MASSSMVTAHLHQAMRRVMILKYGMAHTAV
jgi:hypothetical protein